MVSCQIIHTTTGVVASDRAQEDRSVGADLEKEEEEEEEEEESEVTPGTSLHYTNLSVDNVC